jgi:hypothetical protein
MLSHDLKDLQTKFSDWINGRVEFSTRDATMFEAKLKHAACKAALLELGVDPIVVGVESMVEAAMNVEAEIEAPGSNVVRLSAHRRRVPITVEGHGDGLAS